MPVLKSRRTALIAVAVLWAGHVAAAPGVPPISSFELPPSQGRGVVSALCASGDGRIWVGSDRLFLFDGDSIAAVPLPSGSAIQGIARDEQGRPWIVGPGVVGWLDADAQGDWHLHSLARELEAAGVSILQESWRLGLTPGGMAIVTDQQVIRWTGDRFKTWDLPSKLRLEPSWTDGQLWVFQYGIGLLRLEASGPRLVYPMAKLPGAPIVWVLAQAAPERVMIGTGEGVFERKNEAWVRLPAISRAIAGKLPIAAVALGEDRFAIGTLQGGVVLASMDGRVESVIDRGGGLRNDYVYSLCVGDRQSLWVGMDGAVARIGARGVTEVIDQRQGLEELPVVRIIEHGGRTFALTSRALYDFGAPGATDVVRSADFSGYLWDAASVDQNLFVGGYGGIWRRADSHSTWGRELVNSSDIFCLEGTSRIPGSLMFMDGGAIKALTPSPGGRWTVHDLGADVEKTPLSEVVVGRDDVWVSTQEYGIFHFRWKEHAPELPGLELVRHFRLGLELPDGLSHATLTVLGGELFALCPGGIWAYAQESGRFEPLAPLSGFSGIAAATGHETNAGFWIVESRDAGAATAPALVRVTAEEHPSSFKAQFLDVPGLENAGRIATLNMSGAEPTLWIGGSRALLKVDLRHLEAAPQAEATLMRRISKNGSELASLSPVGRVAFDPNTERLVFEFSSSIAASGEPIAYRTRLLPVDPDWSVPQRELQRTFTGLAPGAYAFQAQAVDRFGRMGKPSVYAFEIIAAWYKRPLTIASAALILLLAILLFTQGRKRALRRQTERLSELVTERTRELALANAAKNEFLENISHEIRNPLNGIVGLTEMLKDAPLAAEERTLARSLGACAESLARVFEDVLGLSKLEYGFVSVEQRAFALEPLLDDVTALFTLQARQQGNTLSVAWPNEFRDGFLGDEGKLKTIVSNFVGNALKYAPGGPVEIAVEVCSENGPADPRCRLTIRVSDHGHGITAAEQEILFKKFVRGAGAKRSGAAGTGLGLAISRALAELLGGKVAVQSEPDKGATFSVSIPLKRTRAPERSVEPLPAVAAAGERALIVEDRDYNQIVLKGLAQKLGYATDVAERSEAAMALVETQRYSVVFLDWELPGLKGGDVARLLRQRPNTRESIIIATTAHDNEEIREKCREAGMDGFALKPYSVSGMRAMLVDCKRQRGEGPSRQPNGGPKGGETQEADFETFRLFAAGDPARADAALDVYLETLAGEISNLARAVEARDSNGVAQVTHHIRSHASLVGDKALNDAARILREKDPQGAPDEFIAAYQKVVARAQTLKSVLLAAKRPLPARGGSAKEPTS